MGDMGARGRVQSNVAFDKTINTFENTSNRSIINTSIRYNFKGVNAKHTTSFSLNTEKAEKSNVVSIGNFTHHNMRTANKDMLGTTQPFQNIGNTDMLAASQPFQHNNIANTSITRIAEDPLNPGTPMGDAVLPMLVCAVIFVTVKLF